MFFLSLMNTTSLSFPFWYNTSSFYFSLKVCIIGSGTLLYVSERKVLKQHLWWNLGGTFDSRSAMSLPHGERDWIENEDSGSFLLRLMSIMLGLVIAHSILSYELPPTSDPAAAEVRADVSVSDTASSSLPSTRSLRAMDHLGQQSQIH